MLGKGSKLLLRDSTCTLEVGSQEAGPQLLQASEAAQVTLDRAVLSLTFASTAACSSASEAEPSGEMEHLGATCLLKVAAGARLTAKDSQMRSELPETMQPMLLLHGSAAILQGCELQKVHILAGALLPEGSKHVPSTLHMRDCKFGVSSQMGRPGLFVACGSKATLTRCSFCSDIQVGGLTGCWGCMHS